MKFRLPFLKKSKKPREKKEPEIMGVSPKPPNAVKPPPPPPPPLPWT